MPDLAVSNDTEIIAKAQKTAGILMICKVHTYGEQTVVDCMWLECALRLYLHLPFSRATSFSIH